jgi:superfamily II DNA or RNA helicase
MSNYKQIKGNTYEDYVLNSLLNEYDNIYHFKDTPEYIIAKTKLYSNKEIYQKYKNCDIGADLVAIKNNDVFFIQCKNFSDTISINDFCSFYFLILEFELNGIVYYNGVLSERLTDLAQGKIKYCNIPYNNTIIDVNFIGKEKIKMEPRDYQLEIYNEFKNRNKGIIALPCGMGKTYCSWLIGKDYDNIIIISPTRNLTDTNLVQLYKYSENTYNPILISMDGSRKYKEIKKILKEKNIISSTYDSVDVLNKITKKIKNYIIFVDEFHNLSKNNLENELDEINKLLVNNNRIIFMSATPLINDNYSNIFGNYVYKYDWNKAIENKYICDFNIILPDKNIDLKPFKDLIYEHEKNVQEIEIITKCYFLLKSIIYYNSKKIILYTSNLTEAHKYSNNINWIKKMLKIEVETNLIDYNTSKINRILYLKQFKTSSSIQILINIQILNEGIDIPECDSVFITKPNDNITNLIQRMCRCNRILINKNKCNIYFWGILYDIPKILSYKKNIEFNYISNNISEKNNTSSYKLIDLQFESNNINIIKKNNELWFNANNIAKIMGYKNPKLSINNNIDDNMKKKLNDLVNCKMHLHPHSIYINKIGLLELVYGSKFKNLNNFKNWINNINL